MEDPFGVSPEDEPTDDDLIRQRRAPGFWGTEILTAIMEAGLGENEFQVAARLAYSQLTRRIKPKLAILWVGLYEGVKDKVKDEEGWDAQTIAEAADALYVGLPAMSEQFKGVKAKAEKIAGKKPISKPKTKAKAKPKTKPKPKPAEINEQLGYE